MSRVYRPWLAILFCGTALALTGCGGTEDTLDEADDSELDVVDQGKADSAPRVQVTTDQSVYSTEQDPVVTVKNSYKATTLYLPGCTATTIQLNVNGTWQDQAPSRYCYWMGLAQKVKAGSSLSDQYGPQKAGTYRVRVAYKTVCRAGKTYMDCSGKEKTVYSASFTVAAAPNGCQTNADCGTNEMCSLAYKSCKPVTPASGTCMPRIKNCITLWDPVCGCDGKTYSNDCFAASAGVEVDDTGAACKPNTCAPVMCELYCPAGYEKDANGCDTCKCKPSGCQVTGCPGTKECQLCKTSPGTADYICIPKGAMC